MNVKQRYQFQKYLRDLQETGKKQKLSDAVESFDWITALAHIEEEFAKGQEVAHISCKNSTQEEVVRKQLRKMGFVIEKSSYYDNNCYVRLKSPFQMTPSACAGAGVSLIFVGLAVGFY
jgi:hypothetical protein